MRGPRVRRYVVASLVGIAVIALAALVFSMIHTSPGERKERALDDFVWGLSSAVEQSDQTFTLLTGHPTGVVEEGEGVTDYRYFADPNYRGPLEPPGDLDEIAQIAPDRFLYSWSEVICEIEEVVGGFAVTGYNQYCYLSTTGILPTNKPAFPFGKLRLCSEMWVPVPTGDPRVSQIIIQRFRDRSDCTYNGVEPESTSTSYLVHGKRLPVAKAKSSWIEVTVHVRISDTDLGCVRADLLFCDPVATSPLVPPDAEIRRMYDEAVQRVSASRSGES